MGRKLLIFGNGLGMSVDPQHFLLKRALKKIWDSPDVLDNDIKTLIETCTNNKSAPQGEHELEVLHQAVVHCKALKEIKNTQNNIHWLNQQGYKFPNAVSKYFYLVARDLYNYEGKLPDDFVEVLVRFIKATNSHVATLNYDKLLYNTFIDHKILNGFNGNLVDGILSDGYDPNNLKRKFDKKFGYYLHLHGSPLFVDNNNRVNKLSRTERPDFDIVGQHIVLTHVNKKPSVISSSNILYSYWEHLSLALHEAEEIILFGYSGLDDHLNNLLRLYTEKNPIRIVEWDGSGDYELRKEFWSTKLNSQNYEILHFKCITEFTDWS